MKKKNLLAALVLVAIAGTLVYSMVGRMSKNTVYYYTVSEVQDVEIEGLIRMAGHVKAGSIQREPERMFVRFEVTDTTSSLPVEYTGPIPDIFAEGIEVIVEGAVEDDVFKASTLLAKCPSKYEKSGKPEDFAHVGASYSSHVSHAVSELTEPTSAAQAVTVDNAVVIGR